MASTTSSEPLCPDWVFCNNNDVHVCKDRGWFDEYVPFESSVTSITGSSRVPVAGVGTVKLPVKKSPNRSGPGAHGHLILRDVVHCPSAVCNLIGLPSAFLEEYDPELRFGGGSGGSQGSIKDAQGRAVAYFVRNNSSLFQVKLSGPPHGPLTGPSVLQGGTYMLTTFWDDSEQARWKNFKNTYNGPPPQNPDSDAAYTPNEKEWLKANYGNEYKFLRDHGLSIFKEEDREEGRAIARQLMTKDGPQRRDGEGTSVHDSEDDGEDSESDLDGHLADYHFDEKSLDWIEKHYGNSANFMFSYGLKFYDDEDCQEAKETARAMLEEDS